MDKYRYGTVIVNSNDAFGELERRSLLLPDDEYIRLDGLFAEEKTWLYWHNAQKQDELSIVFAGINNKRTKEHYTYVQRVYNPHNNVIELYKMNPHELICSYCIIK